MKKSELKALIREVIDMVGEDNVNNRTVEEAYGDASIEARIDNNVFPMSSEDLEALAKEYGVKIYYIGDSQFGTSTLPSYKVKLTAPQGQLDSFVDTLAEEQGIEFYDAPTADITENDETDMNNPEEKREVEIGKSIVSIIDTLTKTQGPKVEYNHIKTLAQELIRMHGQ